MSNLVPPADVAAIAAQIEAAPGLDRLRELLGPEADASPETLAAVLEEAAKFSAAWLAPLNPSMDREGCRLDEGRVLTARGHAEAWQAYVEAGWPGIDQPPELGGAGLPLVALAACTEIFDRGSVAFGMLPTGLRAGARLISVYGDEALKAEWLEKMVSGAWVGTICISEPDAGSDAGRIRTLAEPDGNHGWRITGEKMWISYGDHDLSPRIGHCLLGSHAGGCARGAGLSLFLVPDSIDGERNGIATRRLEEKLGLHGSPTCAMGFEGSQGFLIGAEGRGLAQLFTMIAQMRLMVSVQGLTIASGAADVALAYAEERRQGGAANAPPVPIVEHPDVQRMLAEMASRVEVVRGLVLAAAVQADLSRLETDTEARAEAAALAGWLLPIAKTYASETGFQVASDAIQVLGGAGYVKDWPVEQALRDSRVFAVFEGTSGIQALDLLHRRLRREDGRGLKAFLKLARGDANGGVDAEGLDLLAVLDMLEGAAGQLAADPDGDAGAYDLLELGALAATGWAALRLSRLGGAGAGARLSAAGRWWLTDLKAKAELHLARINLGAGRLELFQAMRRGALTAERNLCRNGCIVLVEAPVADRKLKTYQDKRNFGVTAEPSGEQEVAPSERLRFVIQKHAATRLHYDLRLEYEGVFKSWAVTRGPSLDPHERRLAVEVEDHPLDYGDFEGTIPKGQYGGGTVMLWDRGYWRPDRTMSIEAQLKKGHLTAAFDGGRMKGAWHLVRLDKDRDRSKRTNWLLIKAHDGLEREGDHDRLLEDNEVSIASSRPMDKIAEGKGRGPKPFMTGRAKAAAADAVWQSNRADAKDPVGAKAAAPAIRHGEKAAALPRFVPPQLTKLVDRPPPGADWVHEIKFDGYRLQLRVQKGKGELRTRKGLDWSAKFPEIAKDGGGLADGIYDGEAVALDKEGKPDFAGLQAALSSAKTTGLVFYLFDALYAEGEDLRELPLADRKTRLKAIVEAAPASPRLRYVEHFQSGGDAVLKSACRMDLEGIVSKRLDAPYRSGRSESWTKAKCRGGQEVVIGGWTTTGGTSFRSLIAGVYREGRLIHVGRIGTGFGRDKVEQLLPRLKAVESSASPFQGPDAPRKSGDIHWVKPVLVAEIEFAGWTGDGHIRQASFKALREDKPPAEVQAEGETAQEAVAKDAGAAPARKPAPTKPAPTGSIVLGISISNPNKTLWPADGGDPEVTKIEHARYLEAVSGWMIPHIKGRPCSIIRTPDGIEGKQRFFQRHGGAGTSSLITLTTVWGDRDPYIQIDTSEALIAAAQSGATEFHPWNCQPGDPEVPGRLVFDLDPAPGLDFKDVIEAAKEVKARLEALGLVAFCKTTGGKGLHVVTPLSKAKLDWPAAKGFARELCTRMAADSPDRYLVNMAKAKRTGKIFLDYLRNDRMSTAVAPLSARARAGAPVSFPLTWSQVRAGLDPRKYTVHTAPALLAKTDAWSEYFDSERPLAEAIKRLEKAGRKSAA